MRWNFVLACTLLLPVLAGCASTPGHTPGTPPEQAVRPAAWEPPPTTPVAEAPVGEIDPARLRDMLPAWEDAARAWTPAPDVVRTIREARPARVEIFFGAWCGDSAEHVPPLLAALRAAGNPRLGVLLVALDRQKHEPEGRARARGIERVPTVIVFRGGREIGRVVETPRTTMDRDVAEILAR